jgi:hypothetical protein
MHETRLIDLIRDRVNPEELVDILGVSIDELCIIFYRDIMNEKQKFLDFLDQEEFDNEF